MDEQKIYQLAEACGLDIDGFHARQALLKFAKEALFEHHEGFGGTKMADKLNDQAGRIAELEEEAQEAARVLVRMQARIAQLETALRDLLKWAEDAEVQIEGEWGGGRSLAELEAKGMLSDEIVRARNALKAVGEQLSI